MTQKDVVKDLRKILEPPDSISDDFILEITKGTLFRLQCQFRDLIREILRAIGFNPKW